MSSHTGIKLREWSSGKYARQTVQHLLALRASASPCSPVSRLRIPPSPRWDRRGGQTLGPRRQSRRSEVQLSHGHQRLETVSERHIPEDGALQSGILTAAKVCAFQLFSHKHRFRQQLAVTPAARPPLPSYKTLPVQAWIMCVWPHFFFLCMNTHTAAHTTRKCLSARGVCTAASRSPLSLSARVIYRRKPTLEATKEGDERPSREATAAGGPVISKTGAGCLVSSEKKGPGRSSPAELRPAEPRFQHV